MKIKKIITFFTCFSVFLFLVTFLVIGGPQPKTSIVVADEIPTEQKERLADAGIDSFAVSNCQWIDNCFFCQLDAGKIHEPRMEITCNYQADKANYQHDPACVSNVTQFNYQKSECKRVDPDRYNATCMAISYEEYKQLDICTYAATDYSLEEVVQNKVAKTLTSFRTEQKTVAKVPTVRPTGDIK